MAAQDFFNRVYRDARDIGATHVQAAIAAAQSAIETGWGKSVRGNAYFGIKAGPSWKGRTVTFTTHEVVNGRRVKVKAAFRAYDDFRDSLRDHLATLEAKWPNAFAAETFEEAADGLMNGVHGAYATDPDYADKVLATARKRTAAAVAAYEGASGGAAKAAPDNPASKILPLYRPQQREAVTLAVLDSFADLTPPARRRDRVRVLIVRGYYRDSMGRKGANDRALYDDAVLVVSPEGVQPFNGNSDPAVYRKRVATLKAPQAIRYRPGLHGFSRPAGPYPAFRQDSDVTVIRDGAGEDRDSAAGRFWINLHRGGANGTSSLGCLTVPPHQWDEFHKLLTGLLDKHGQGTFFVTLVEYAGGHPPVSVPDEATGGKVAGGAAAGGAAVAAAGEAAQRGIGWTTISLWLAGAAVLAVFAFLAWKHRHALRARAAAVLDSLKRKAKELTR